VAREGSGPTSEIISKDKKGTDDVRPDRKWRKRLGALAAAIGLIGGVITIVGAADNWFSKLTSDPTCGISKPFPIERSPRLGISFHQDNQLALMSSVNSNGPGIPLTDVCLSSAPFEIWFPSLGPRGLVQVCISSMAEEFRIDALRIEPNATGCLTNNGDGATPSYIGGFLPEASLQYGTSLMIFGTRAEPAGNGDEKYFVSRLYSVPSVKGFSYHTVPLSRQSSELYMIIYSTSNYDDPGSEANIEHFVLQFK